jgi:inositol transport system ATP-binding protein
MDGNDSSVVLVLRDIVKTFPGVRALDGISLQIKKGRVHIIAGENGAGKSTLMKIINGDYLANEGEIFYQGQKLGKRTITETIQMGISMIHQELSSVRLMTIAENIFLGREPQRIKGVVNYKKMYDDTKVLLKQLNINFDPHQKMESLSIAGQQQIEIAKAISRNANVIIMDEPTSAISNAEVEILFNQIIDLKNKGVAIIYITHKMDEIFRIADDITIIRDGRWISSGSIKDYTIDKVISLMVGRTITNIFPKIDVEIGEVVLEVKNLTSYGKFENISFKLHKGEILGVSGLVGSGRTEVMRAIFGLDPIDKGEIFIRGHKVDIRDTHCAINLGIAMASEDRRQEGIIPLRSVRENITLPSIKQFARLFAINKNRELEEVNRMIEMLAIKASSPEQLISQLSGGNQQKVILAKWLLRQLNVMILDEPTRGIDIGSKSEIHRLMGEFAKGGLGIIMVSSELPEVIGMSDRVMIMKQGKITGEIARAMLNQESVMRLAI